MQTFHQKNNTRILLVLHFFATTVKAFLDWEVSRRITRFEEEIVLFCRVDQCCNKPAGWAKRLNNFNSDSIFLNVQNLKYDNTRKYDGRIGNNGFYLFIRNFSLEDTKYAYSCSYGLNSSKPKILTESMIFRESTSNVAITAFSVPPSAPTNNDNNRINVVIITVLGTSFFFVICFISIHSILRKRWKRMYTGRLIGRSNIPTAAIYETVDQRREYSGSSLYHMSQKSSGILFEPCKAQECGGRLIDRSNSQTADIYESRDRRREHSDSSLYHMSQKNSVRLKDRSNSFTADIYESRDRRRENSGSSLYHMSHKSSGILFEACKAHECGDKTVFPSKDMNEEHHIYQRRYPYETAV